MYSVSAISAAQRKRYKDNINKKEDKNINKKEDKNIKKKIIILRIC